MSIFSLYNQWTDCLFHNLRIIRYYHVPLLGNENEKKGGGGGLKLDISFATDLKYGDDTVE